MVDPSPGPATQDLKIFRGDTFVFFFRLRSQVWDADALAFVSGLPVDLTGYSFEAQIKATLASPSSLADLTITLLDQSAEETRGYVLAGLTPTETAALGSGLSGLNTESYTKFGVWDMQIIEPDASVTTIWAGSALLRGDVTS